MIKVNGKELKVGDTVVFRCGGEANVADVNFITLDLQNIRFKGEDYSCVYMRTGESTVSSNFDIIDIKKAPKNNISVLNITIFNDRLKISIDETNRKVLSVEIEEN